MMRRDLVPLATLAMTGLVAFATPTTVFGQAETAAGSASRARTANERVNTEASTPPPVNSDYRRAAEGTLPQVPGAVGTVGGAAAIDPAARPLGAVNNPIAPASLGAALPPGMDAAMMIEHALAMGLDGSNLASLAAANSPDEAGNDAVKSLMTRADDEMRTSKELLGKAAQAGSNLDPNSPIRRFYHTASDYMKTLESLSTPGTLASPNDKAQLAAINNAVLGGLESNQINQFGGMGASSPAMEALMSHARLMKDQAGKTLDRIGGTAPLDPSAPVSPIILAQKGRELLGAADAVAPLAAQMYGGNAAMGFPGGGLRPSMNVGPGPFPGRLQDNRPEIVGGTYGTGAPTAGTATGVEAARNVKNSTEGPGGVLNVPTPTGGPGAGPSGYGVGNNNTPPTTSTAGSRPK